MYARKVEGETLRFTVSGMLWNRSLVMRDLETGTLWSHLLGRGMRGTHEGHRLEILPSELTDWKSWRARHRETTVLGLERTAADFVRDFQKQPGRFVFGIRVGGDAVAYPYDRLADERVVNDTVGGRPLVVTFDRESATARVFSATVDQRVLRFTAADDDGRLRDDATGSTWDAASGECLAGELEGRRLAPEVGIPSFRRAWRAFHPDSRVHGTPSGE